MRHVPKHIVAAVRASPTMWAALQTLVECADEDGQEWVDGESIMMPFGAFDMKTLQALTRYGLAEQRAYFLTIRALPLGRRVLAEVEWRERDRELAKLDSASPRKDAAC